MHLQGERSQAVCSKSARSGWATLDKSLVLSGLSSPPARWGVEPGNPAGPFPFPGSLSHGLLLSLLCFTSGVSRETGQSPVWFSELSAPTGRTHSSDTIDGFGNQSLPCRQVPSLSTICLSRGNRGTPIHSALNSSFRNGENTAFFWPQIRPSLSNSDRLKTNQIGNWWPTLQIDRSLRN